MIRHPVGHFFALVLLLPFLINLLAIHQPAAKCLFPASTPDSGSAPGPWSQPHSSDREQSPPAPLRAPALAMLSSGEWSSQWQQQSSSRRWRHDSASYQRTALAKLSALTSASRRPGCSQQYSSSLQSLSATLHSRLATSWAHPWGLRHSSTPVHLKPGSPMAPHLSS